MNRKAIVAAIIGILVGFGAGLGVGLFHRSNASSNSSGLMTTGESFPSEPRGAAGRLSSISTNSSANALETTNSAKRLSTLADLEVAFRSQSGRDLGKAAEV